jgi:hypothetical protein
MVNDNREFGPAGCSSRQSRSGVNAGKPILALGARRREQGGRKPIARVSLFQLTRAILERILAEGLIAQPVRN